VTRFVPQPPFSADLLADLHADNVSPDSAAELRNAVRDDAEAQSYLGALDGVRDQLRELGSDESIIHAMPADVADRLGQLAEELGGPVPAELDDHGFDAEPADAKPTQPSNTVALPDLSHRRESRTGGQRSLRLLAAAAAAIIAIAGVSIMVNTARDSDTEPVAAPPTATTDADSAGTEPTVTDTAITPAVALTALGRNDVSGRLAEPTALTGCIRAAGVDQGILGSTNMDYQGSSAVLVLVGGGQNAQITALIVGPGCKAGDPQVLAVTDIG